MVTLFVHISKKLISYVYISDWIQIPMLIDDDEIISGDGDEPRDQKWKQKEAMKIGEQQEVMDERIAPKRDLDSDNDRRISHLVWGEQDMLKRCIHPSRAKLIGVNKHPSIPCKLDWCWESTFPRASIHSKGSNPIVSRGLIYLISVYFVRLCSKLYE